MKIPSDEEFFVVKGLVPLTEEQAAAIAARIAEKGHDCWDPENVVHEVDDSLRLRDVYTCRICGDLLQVG